MIQKKLPYNTMLAIALMLSMLRLDWTDYFREDILISNSGFHDTMLGPSVGLTETQFHNLYNSVGQTHSKNIIRDSFYDRSPFHELDSLYERPPVITSPRSRDLTAFLLDRQEASTAQRLNGQLLVAQQPANPTPGHNTDHATTGNHDAHGNHHESDSDEGFEEMDTEVEGAVGHSHAVSPTPSDDLSTEDMDLIESLWRQDIDMGVCPETYPYKTDITKPGFTEELKKQGLDIWDYSIDGETGEFVPGPQQELEESVQRTIQPPVIQQPPSQPQPQTQVSPQEGSLSLEDCLQLLEEEYSPDTTPTDLNPALTQQEAEQRWQDLATIPELQGSIPELLPTATLNSSQDGYTAVQPQFMPTVANGSAGISSEISELPPPQILNDVFAVNASTNGMVSLQNATQPHSQPSLLMPPAHATESFNNFTNLNVDPPIHSANATSVAPSNENMTNYLMQTLQHQMTPVNVTAPYPASNLSMPDNSSSLLMELLNSPGSAQPINPLDLDFDEQMHDVIAALGEDAESLSDEESDGSIFDDEEGAAGYSSSSDQEHFKGAAGGYGFSRGHEREYGSDSSSNSYSGQPPKMENIKHNHSYSSPSQSEMQNGNGASNSSHNGTNGYNGMKLNRDEKRAKALKLPINVEKIINLPVDAFNDLMKKYELNDAQLQLVRDIRRRGKNKVAAQNCRKRKIDAIMMVEETVGELRMERDKLVKERDNIDKEVSDMQQRYAELCNEVFSSIQDEHGAPVDPNDYTLQQMPDGTVFLIPRNGNSSHRDRDEQSM